MSIGSVLARAGHLFALVLAPRLPSPEPLAEPGAIEVALGLTAVVVPPIVGIALVRRYGVAEAKFTAAAWAIASMGLLYGASETITHAPLLASYYTAAPFVWLALALTAATLAGQHLSSTFRNKRMGAALIVVAVGVFLYRDAHKLVRSPTDQWLDVLARDPANARAFHEVRPHLAADRVRFDAALGACLVRKPDACHCREERASSRLEAGDPAATLGELDESACPASDTRAARLRATAAALALPPADADAVVTAMLETHPDDATVLGARAIVLERSGKPDEARALAERAVEGGAGYETRLLLSALWIAAGELERARDLLTPLAKDHPESADVVFNAALIADKQGRYNDAREGYLTALRLRPTLANSRYNLALLTLRYGFTEEARNHAARFREAFPDDPRGPGLLARVFAGN